MKLLILQSRKIKKNTQMSRLPPLPTLSELLKIYNLQASKQLSQNFLLDLHVTDKIVRHCFPNKLTKQQEEEFTPKTTVIEVGPGPGPLTRSLLNSDRVKRVIAVEKDDRFIPALQLLGQAADKRFNLVQGDILKVDEDELLNHFNEDSVLSPSDPDFEEKWKQTLNSHSDPNVVLTGNLPFGIATPLLIKWLRDLSDKKGAFKYGRVPMVLMFQKEVGDRLCARPKTKDYSRISIVTQNFCEAKECFVIKGKTFIPPPKVDASVIRLDPRPEPLEPDLPMPALEQFCNVIFHSRRKQLYSNLRAQLTESEITQLVSMCTKKELIQKQEEENNLRLLDIRPASLDVEAVCHLAKQYSILKENRHLI
jgi:dimethyladenosine transferase 1